MKDNFEKRFIHQDLWEVILEKYESTRDNIKLDSVQLEIKFDKLERCTREWDKGVISRILETSL